ncbi:MAG: hypothetical protein KDK04_06180, partial [Candidatus Competibacteraceae bacterium]|nr:hypothetical protein [Candidatus Competibacteraceae bacterium]
DELSPCQRTQLENDIDALADLLLKEDEQTDELSPCQRTQLENDIDAYNSMEWESLQVFVSDLLPPASDQPSPTQPT